MVAVGWMKYTFLAYFSKPKSLRKLYRLVKRRRVCRLVEIGVSDIDRAVMLVEIAQRFGGKQSVSYTGLDWFDTRSAELPALSLKEAHRTLSVTEAKVRLVPGEPGRSLTAVANAHQHTGLILISDAVTDADLAVAWFYLPRMLDAQSVVLRESVDAEGEPVFTEVSAAEIEQMATAGYVKRAA